MREILEKFKTGSLSLEEAEKKLKLNYFDEIGGFCKLDTNRKLSVITSYSIHYTKLYELWVNAGTPTKR